MNWRDLSVYTQLLLTVYFIVTHWIQLSPWNNINKKDDVKFERTVDLIVHLLQIVMVYGTNQNIAWAKVMTLVFYSVWMIGQILIWWVPYLFGTPKILMGIVNSTTKNTFNFLPKIKNHSVPDACQFFIGLLTIAVVVCVWMNLIN